MKSFLKKLLLNVADAAKDTAMGMVPGSDLVLKGVAALIDKNDTNNVEAVDNLQNGIMTAINAIAPAQIENKSVPFFTIRNGSLSVASILQRQAADDRKAQPWNGGVWQYALPETVGATRRGRPSWPISRRGGVYPLPP